MAVRSLPQHYHQRSNAMMTNWSNPEDRLDLIERVGPAEYARLQRREHRRNTVTVISGRKIILQPSRFGALFAISGTSRAFKTFEQAVDFITTKGRREL